MTKNCTSLTDFEEDVLRAVFQTCAEGKTAPRRAVREALKAQARYANLKKDQVKPALQSLFDNGLLSVSRDAKHFLEKGKTVIGLTERAKTEYAHLAQ